MTLSRVVTAAALVAALGVSARAATTPAKPGSPQALYEKNCGSCHGADLKGKAAMAKPLKVDPSTLDLTKVATAAKNDQELIDLTAKGKGKMPGYEKKLTAQQIKDIVAYIRTIVPQPQTPK